MMAKSIQTTPKPYCPICGAQMVLRIPKGDQNWDPFWGCSQYPNCRGTRNIQEDGTPEDDDLMPWDFEDEYRDDLSDY